MDNQILRKKLSTYVSDSGRLRNVSEPVLCEVLNAWENWEGTASSFYRSIGFSPKQMAKLIGKAKKLKREGSFGSEEFTQLHTEDDHTEPASNSKGECQGIELLLDGGKLLRFQKVSQVIEFLKQAG
ncbi:MAG: hypothetical protein HRU19_01125 [Pseudobacteriovorax sp.]|nr:hypothetical protein [Pseudobacteriovorax sp.]